VYLAVCAGVTAFCLGYALVDYAKISHLYYLQREHEWRMAARMSGAPSGYVGLWVWALVAGAVAAAATYGLTRLGRRPLAARGLGLALAWTLTAFVGAGAYFTWNNLP